MSDTVDPNTVTADRTQIELWQKSAALLDRMLGDPSIAPQAEELISKVNPNAVFPARAGREAMYAPVKAEIESVRAESAAKLEAANAFGADLKARLDARDAKDAEIAAKAQETALTNRLTDIQARRGFTDETMQRVLERMREQNNPDVDAAAAWVAESIPKPLPASGHDYLPSTVDVYGSSEDPATTAWKGLHENPTRWMDNELRATIKDPDFLRLGQ